MAGDPGGPVDDAEDDDDALEVGWLPIVACLVALVALAAVPALPPLLRTYRPDLAVAGAAQRQADVDPWGKVWGNPDLPPDSRYSGGPNGVDDRGQGDDLPAVAAGLDPRLVTAVAWSRELALALGLVATWVAMSLGRLRHPRVHWLREVLRGGFLASVPAFAGAGVLLWLCGAFDTTLEVPHVLTGVRPFIEGHLGDLAAKVAWGPGLIAVGIWIAFAWLVGIIVRRVMAAPAED